MKFALVAFLGIVASLAIPAAVLTIVVLVLKHAHLL
jgi:hypothetical protein